MPITKLKHEADHKIRRIFHSIAYECHHTHNPFAGGATEDVWLRWRSRNDSVSQQIRGQLLNNLVS